MKNILLLIHDDQGQESRLQVALDLTRALNGHLTCVDVAALPVALAGDYYGGASAGVVIEVGLEHEAKNRARVEKRLLSESLSWTWIDVTNTLADGVLEAASLADLIVLSRKLDSHSGPDMLGISSSIVMHAGKPVVAVPENTRRMALGRALVAWDGQSSCAATVRACVPLLALADDVEIFMVRDGSAMTEPLEAAQYLSQHNVHAEVRIIEGDHRQVNELIAEECSRFGADYILMGAYGRGRLMEAFGGVTKRLLAASTVPLVLGH